MTSVVGAKKQRQFDPKTFLSTTDGGRQILAFSNKQTIFAQSDSSDAVFYIQKGKVRLTVVSAIGKEATIGILNEGDFFGEACLTGQSLHPCSATAMTDCSVMRIDKTYMMEALHEEHVNVNYPFRWLTKPVLSKAAAASANGASSPTTGHVGRRSLVLARSRSVHS